MSPLNLFKKEIQCDICGINLKKSDAFKFDSTIRGERHDGEKLYLCKKCFLDKLKQVIRTYQGKAIFYYPIKGDNAYHYYKFKENFAEELENEDSEMFPPPKCYKLMPKEGERCICCNKNAHFTWCKSNAFEKIDTYNVSDIPNQLVKIEYLCSECLINKFIDAIEDENIIFKEFFPPVDKEGIGISGDC